MVVLFLKTFDLVRTIYSSSIKFWHYLIHLILEVKICPLVLSKALNIQEAFDISLKRNYLVASYSLNFL